MTLSALQAFIGELARPFAIIATSTSAAISTVIVAQRVETGEGGALVLGAIYAGVGALYGVKSWEKAKVAVQSAEVEKARVQGGGASEALKPAEPVPEEIDPAMYGGPRP